MEPNQQTQAPANLIDLINDLTEPHTPPPVPMTPQTWGWAALALLILALLALGAWLFWRRHRANAYRRAALVALADAGDDPARIAEILRRTALAAYPRRDIAGLSGPGWLSFLDAQTGGSVFSAGAGRAIATAPYRPTGPDPDLTGAARDWIRHHKSEAA